MYFNIITTKFLNLRVISETLVPCDILLEVVSLTVLREAILAGSVNELEVASSIVLYDEAPLRSVIRLEVDCFLNVLCKSVPSGDVGALDVDCSTVEGDKVFVCSGDLLDIDSSIGFLPVCIFKVSMSDTPEVWRSYVIVVVVVLPEVENPGNGFDFFPIYTVDGFVG
ncbi:hypothetical protein V3C99_009284 [Haemonchus contortus]